ncbi:uncharacterized protein LOC135501728 [Lineus longissimus]|uniref:uncharacterized protein LOC135501718 n=1 Tax=Lineus longissimus TaxID=88925 RepID=UPI00315D0D63
MNIQFVLATILLVGIFGLSEGLSYLTTSRRTTPPTPRIPTTPWRRTTPPPPSIQTTHWDPATPPPRRTDWPHDHTSTGRKCTMEVCYEPRGGPCKHVIDAYIKRSNKFTVECGCRDHCKTHVEVDYVEEWKLYKTNDRWGQECRCNSDGSVTCH